MGAAPMAYALWSRVLNTNPKNSHWFNRDRFVLSAGHGSMLLYSLLHLSGFKLELEDLKNFRQWKVKPWSPRISLYRWCRRNYWSTWSRYCDGCWYGYGRKTFRSEI